MLDEWKLTVKSAALSGQVVLDRRMLLVKRPGAVAQTLGVSRLSNLSCELCLSKLDAPDAEVETSRKATNTSRLLALSHRPLYSNTTYPLGQRLLFVLRLDWHVGVARSLCPVRTQQTRPKTATAPGLPVDLLLFGSTKLDGEHHKATRTYLVSTKSVTTSQGSCKVALTPSKKRGQGVQPPTSGGLFQILSLNAVGFSMKTGHFIKPDDGEGLNPNHRKQSPLLHFILHPSSCVSS